MRLNELFKDEDDLANWLDLNNYSWRGGFSEVYDLGGDYVLKVTEDESYLSFFKLLTEYMTGNKHFPVIYDYWVIDNCYYILMEKLYHHDLFISEEAEMAGYYSYDARLWSGISGSLNKSLDILESWFNIKHKEDDLHWDLRDSNVMQRKDGTLVITDPFSESEYNNW
ncbi:hypothetical protein vBVpaMR16F_249 [Vibrio phage vB_VpaM_R16F]|nr:hypothetical protein vBVpaMR16F_249 [Vibrio phage vB_VpaM_R16F]